MLFWRSLLQKINSGNQHPRLNVQTHKLRTNWSWFGWKNCGRQSICVVRDCRWTVGSILALLFQAAFQERQLEVEEKSNLSLVVERIYVLENIYIAACWTGWQGEKVLKHHLASFPLIVSRNDVHICFHYFVSCAHYISKFLRNVRANAETMQWEFSKLFLVKSPELQHYCRIQDEMQ